MEDLDDDDSEYDEEEHEMEKAALLSKSHAVTPLVRLPILILPTSLLAPPLYAPSLIPPLCVSILAQDLCISSVVCHHSTSLCPHNFTHPQQPGLAPQSRKMRMTCHPPTGTYFETVRVKMKGQALNDVVCRSTTMRV